MLLRFHEFHYVGVPLFALGKMVIHKMGLGPTRLLLDAPCLVTIKSVKSPSSGT